MVDIRPQRLEYDEDDEHILRRLGGAVVVQWSSLPKDIQDQLQKQAGLMADRFVTVQLKEQIQLFIEAHHEK